MKTPYTLGILGGAGPRAAVKFQQYFLDAWNELTGSWRDADFPRLVVDTKPLKGMNETGISDLSRFEKDIWWRIDSVDFSHCDAVVVPCFSAHSMWKPRNHGQRWINLRHLAMEQFEPPQHPYSITMLEAEGTTPEDKTFRREWENHFNTYVCPLGPGGKQIVEKLIQEGMGKDTQRYFAPCFGGSKDIHILGCSELSLVNLWNMNTYDALKGSAIGLSKYIKKVTK